MMGNVPADSHAGCGPFSVRLHSDTMEEAQWTDDWVWRRPIGATRADVSAGPEVWTLSVCSPAPCNYGEGHES